MNILSRQTRRVMRPDWNDLLFLHWPIAAGLLQPLVPQTLQIDTFQGQAYIGLVPFAMLNSHPSWMSPFVKKPWRRFSSDFLELNVRTYVKHPNGQSGVWFFSLDAASLPAVIAARLWFKLPYFYAKMYTSTHNNSCRYFSRRLWPAPLPARCRLEYAVENEAPQISAPNSLDEFLLERYHLFSQRGKRLFCGQVHHSPYAWQHAQVLALDENVVRAAGIKVSGLPPIVHFSRGVRVEVSPLQRVLN